MGRGREGAKFCLLNREASWCPLKTVSALLPSFRADLAPSWPTLPHADRFSWLLNVQERALRKSAKIAISRILLWVPPVQGYWVAITMTAEVTATGGETQRENSTQQGGRKPAKYGVPQPRARSSQHAADRMKHRKPKEKKARRNRGGGLPTTTGRYEEMQQDAASACPCSGVEEVQGTGGGKPGGER